MQVTCPVCERGELNDHNVCLRCGIAVPLNGIDTWPALPKHWRRRRYPADQDFVGPMTDYARTKADKDE